METEFYGEKREKQGAGRIFAGILAILGLLLSGFLFALAAAFLNGRQFGPYLWSLIVSVDMFSFATAGFFLTEGKKELLYGACSILAADCIILQLWILF